MLYNRLAEGKDMLEYADCVNRLLVPLFQMKPNKELFDSPIRQILRG